MEPTSLGFQTDIAWLRLGGSRVDDRGDHLVVRGLARSLIHHGSRYGFGTLGARTLVIVADPDSFAIDLYRSVGFATVETQSQVERPPPA